MPGGHISTQQKELLEILLEDKNLVLSVKKSDSCSVNIHGRFDLQPKKRNIPGDSASEDLLGLKGRLTATSEPPAHFHVTWSRLQWMHIREQQNRRMSMSCRVGLCTAKVPESGELHFYVREGPVIRKLLRRAVEFDDREWVPFH